MRILVVGSGGREHALVWKIKQSPKVKELYCAPGNGGIAQMAQCVDIEAEDIKGLLKYASEQKIDLTVVGPELPLVDGIVDEFTKAGLKIFGPTKKAAQLEGSKVYAKQFMRKYQIPTAEFQIFSNPDDARHVFRVVPVADYPIVIKADGLAAGKGVVICKNFLDLEAALVDIMEKKVFKEAGHQVVVEDGLSGEEISILALCDGKNFVLLEPSQDHKRVFEGDQGPNTGGMGAYSPVPVVSRTLIEKIAREIIKPTVQGMAQEGHPFKGILYAGLMLTEDGPKVLEYNVRFGDPEAQVVIPRLKNDLVEVLLSACDGNLSGLSLSWDRRSCVCVVMSSRGYPGPYETGKEIYGLDLAQNGSQTMVFHAGTRKVGNKFLTSGGRVLGITGFGKNMEEAIKITYQSVEKIIFEKYFFRRDIGFRALKKIKV